MSNIKMKGGDEKMCCHSFTHGSARNFLTKDEKVEMLKEYKGDLESEAKGVAERIKELESE